MKITDVTTESYSWPRQRPIRNGKYTYTTAGLSLTRVEHKLMARTRCAPHLLSISLPLGA